MPDESFTELTGERVALRRFHLQDVTEFVAYRSSVEVARYQSTAWPARPHADNAEHLDEHIRLREEDLAADAALSEEAGRDLGDDDSNAGLARQGWVSSLASLLANAAGARETINDDQPAPDCARALHA